MNDSNVAERLKSYIEFKGLSYAQFADTCKIPRPSLSQLLTGRNKKINDIMVGQIHNAFPDLSILWLLFGEGPMENSASENSESGVDAGAGFSDGLFAYPSNDNFSGGKRNFPTGARDENEILKENGLRGGINGSQISDAEEEKLRNMIKELRGRIDEMKKNPRKAVQITDYYDDSTFETFFPRT